MKIKKNVGKVNDRKCGEGRLKIKVLEIKWRKGVCNREGDLVCASESANRIKMIKMVTNDNACECVRKIGQNFTTKWTRIATDGHY